MEPTGDPDKGPVMQWSSTAHVWCSRRWGKDWADPPEEGAEEVAFGDFADVTSYIQAAAPPRQAQGRTTEEEASAGEAPKWERPHILSLIHI